MFKTREIYTKRLGSGEEFDAGCMCISSFGDDGSRYITIGSFAGILRVFSVPKSIAAAKAEATRGDNALLEEHLNSPILQVGSGRLISGNEKMCLAVLQQRKLTVYNLLIDNDSTNCSIKAVYEHSLARTASNMICSTFGGSSRREFICVQSADCTLTVFEQETPVFVCFPSDCLLPSRLTYLRSTDSFILTHGDALRAYKHRTLAAASAKAAQKDDSNSSTSQRMRADWSVILSESCIDLAVCDHPEADNAQSVVCITENHVFCAGDSGKLHFMQKMTHEPVSIFCYNFQRTASSKSSGSKGAENLNNRSGILVNYLVGTRASVLLVYENATVKWACRTDFIPVQIGVTNLGGLSGVLVLLAEQGLLSLAFIGTEPSIAVSGSLAGSSVTLSADQQSKWSDELKSLQRVVRDTASGSQPVVMPKMVNADDELTLQLSVEVGSDKNGVGLAAKKNNNADAVDSATLTVTLRSKSAALANVDVTAQCNLPIRAVPLTVTHFGSFDSRSAASQNFVVFRLECEQKASADGNASPTDDVEPMQRDPKAKSDAIPVSVSQKSIVPTDLRVLVCATYSSTEAEQAGRVTVAYTRMPFAAVARLCAAKKDAHYKVTFSVSESMNCNLNELFRDVCGSNGVQSHPGGGSTLGLRITNIDQVVSVLATRNKFRIQSDRPDLIYLPLKTLLDRMQSYAGGSLPLPGQQLHGRPPVDALLAQIETAFSLRLRLIESRAQLNKHAALLRDVQKRAFAKLREDAPTHVELPESSTATDTKQEDEMDNIESLLDDAHSQLLQSVDELTLAAQLYRVALSSLDSALRLAALCTQMSLGLGSAELRALECLLLIEHVVQIANQPLSVAETASKTDSESDASAAPQKIFPGWEELVDAVLVNVLKQAAAQGKADRLEASSLQMPKSVDKLCKHIQIFFDKLLNRQFDLASMGAQMNLIATQDGQARGAGAGGSGQSSGNKASDDRGSNSRSTNAAKEKENLKARLDTVNRLAEERDAPVTQSPRSLLNQLPKLDSMNTRQLPSVLGSSLNKAKGTAMSGMDFDADTPSQGRAKHSRQEVPDPVSSNQSRNEADDYF